MRFILQLRFLDHKQDAHRFWKLMIKRLVVDNWIYQYGFLKSIKINIAKKVSTTFECVDLKKSMLLISFSIYS